MKPLIDSVEIYTKQDGYYLAVQGPCGLNPVGPRLFAANQTPLSGGPYDSLKSAEEARTKLIRLLGERK